MHAAVTPTGVISFRYQYRVNGRQEVLTIGRYSAEAARKVTRAPDALEYGMEVSLAGTRTLLARARRQVVNGRRNLPNLGRAKFPASRLVISR